MDSEEDRLVAERLSHVRSIGALTAGATSMSVLLMGVLALGAMREVRRRAGLERFLPAEIAPLLAAGDQSLRPGGNRMATIVFVDIRDSTRIAERLDPAELSLLLSRFRRKVMDAAQASDGMVDKFMGDGALIVFGALGQADRAAADALSFARDLLGRVESAPDLREGGEPAFVRIGVGIHCGEVFCGIIGDDDRLEFTVLGDTVNVAARIEGATKRFGAQLLVSEDVLIAAREPRQLWREVSNEALPGREGRILIYAERPQASI